MPPATKPQTASSLLAVRPSFQLRHGGRAVVVRRVRSLRRALHKMVSDGVVVELGKGGRAGPYHYYFHPAMLAGLFEKSEMLAICQEMDRIEAAAKRSQ